MNKNKGFTLIELLVVIAIIGILSSVVLASLNTARAKGANAAVKANLNNIRAQAELVYDNASPNSYATVCGDPNVWKGVLAAGSAAGVTYSATALGASNYGCNSTSAGWIAFSALKTAEGTSVAWCVDSTGNSKGLAATTYSSSTVACP
ncbi:MAG: type II secretion system protein [Candidatus Taylorbacteria bacterium]|nr:type II secretion system protein [Candidatus Taylorbacteria bacterium]